MYDIFMFSTFCDICGIPSWLIIQNGIIYLNNIEWLSEMLITEVNVILNTFLNLVKIKKDAGILLRDV